MTKGDLIKRIKQDFPLLPLPSPVVNKLGGGFEPQLVQDYFQGKNWQEVARVLLRGYESDAGSCLLFMNADAYCYYLPAYILMSLENYDLVGDTTKYDSLLYDLALPLIGEKVPLDRDWHLDRFEKFTFQQKRDIADYLAYEDTTHGELSGDAAKEAFESYWYQFASPLARPKLPLHTP